MMIEGTAESVDTKCSILYHTPEENVGIVVPMEQILISHSVLRTICNKCLTFIQKSLLQH
jgi:hypothetical protein